MGLPAAAPGGTGCTGCGCRARALTATGLSDPQGLNRYAYVVNNPETLVDLRGTQLEDCCWFWVKYPCLQNLVESVAPFTDAGRIAMEACLVGCTAVCFAQPEACPACLVTCGRLHGAFGLLAAGRLWVGALGCEYQYQRCLMLPWEYPEVSWCAGL